MEVVTKEHLCQNIEKHWRNQYPDTRNETLERLRELSPKTEQGIIDIVGNSTWTDIRCDECKELVDMVVVVGEKPNYESYTASICPKCLRKAMKLLKQKQK